MFRINDLDIELQKQTIYMYVIMWCCNYHHMHMYVCFSIIYTQWRQNYKSLTALLALICKGNPSGTRGVPLERFSNKELLYSICCQPKQAVEQTV